LATVLLGWELGSGLDHRTALTEIARGLATQGHDPVLAFREANAFLPHANPFPILPAPSYRPPRHAGAAPFRAATFADIMAIRGFADPEILASLVNNWQALLQNTGAKLAICDFSPGLTLAAYGVVPAFQVGAGFAVPPADGHSFPQLDSAASPAADPERLLAVIRIVQERRGLPSPETLPRLFASVGRFVRTVPEIDPYRELRCQEMVGPLRPLPEPRPMPPEPAFFAYLKADYPGIAYLLTDLARSGLRGTVYLGGADGPARVRWQSVPGLQFLEEPPDLSQVLPPVSAVLHHGGAGVTQAALAVGRPQVLLPRHLEQELTGRALERLGVGLSLTGALTPSRILGVLANAAVDSDRQKTALCLAEEFDRRRPSPLLPAILRQCLAMVPIV